MGGPNYRQTNRTEIMMAQFRAEELLLELVMSRLQANKPLAPEALDEEATERYKGYYEGWWEAVETLSNVIDAHNEGNSFHPELR